MFSTLAIIGVGLLGGSLGLAARKHKVAHRILGVGRNRETLAAALDIGAIDEFSLDYDALAAADLIVVCTPVDKIVEHARLAAWHGSPGVLITDVGSTKQLLVKHIEQDLKRSKRTAEFVGSHPMAGSEKQGARHAKANLFENRKVIVTPTKRTSDESVERVTEFWRALGAWVHHCSPAEHDKLVAAASHVPHLVASALAASTPAASLPLVAGGWLDSTRVAAGDPELWLHILSQNRGPVLQSLKRFQKVLAQVQQALETENRSKILHLLQAGKQTRDTVGN